MWVIILIIFCICLGGTRFLARLWTLWVCVSMVALVIILFLWYIVTNY